MLERLFHLEKYGEELVQIIRGKAQQWQGMEKEQQGALSGYKEVTREKAEELKKEEKACEEQFQKEALELQETRGKLEEEKIRLEAQKEYDSLEKEAGQLEEQRAEMLLGRGSDRTGPESGEALERSSGFPSGTADPGRAERKAGAAFRGTEKNWSRKKRFSKRKSRRLGRKKRKCFRTWRYRGSAWRREWPSWQE